MVTARIFAVNLLGEDVQEAARLQGALGGREFGVGAEIAEVVGDIGGGHLFRSD
jgi:hypothetical protein